MENPQNRPETIADGVDSDPGAPNAAYRAPSPSGDPAAHEKRTGLLQQLYRKFRPLVAAGALLAAEMPQPAAAADAEPKGGQANQEQVAQVRAAEISQWAAELGVPGLSLGKGRLRTMGEQAAVLMNGELLGYVAAADDPAATGSAFSLRFSKGGLLGAISSVLRESGVQHNNNPALTGWLAELEVPGLEVGEAKGPTVAGHEVKGLYVGGRHIGDVTSEGELHTYKGLLYRAVVALHKAGIPLPPPAPDDRGQN